MDTGGNQTPSGGLAGLRVLSLESRRSAEMAKLIASQGGAALVAPSMQEVPLQSNTEALAFARTLVEGRASPNHPAGVAGFDLVIFLTGVGTRALVRVAETLYPREQLLAALRHVTVVVRGPKPAAVLKELAVPIALAVPEPNTWRELLQALDERPDAFPLKDRRIAIQEYGASNPELLAGLAERGALVTRVPVYEWSLPQDTGPLRAAVEAITRGEIDVALFTTSVQVVHLLRIAAEMNLEADVRRAFVRIAVGSIGPVTSDVLRQQRFSVDFEPVHPKMGFLVHEAAEQAADILEKKRYGSTFRRH